MRNLLSSGQNSATLERAQLNDYVNHLRQVQSLARRAAQGMSARGAQGQQNPLAVARATQELAAQAGMQLDPEISKAVFQGGQSIESALNGLIAQAAQIQTNLGSIQKQNSRGQQTSESRSGEGGGGGSNASIPGGTRGGAQSGGFQNIRGQKSTKGMPENVTPFDTSKSPQGSLFGQSEATPKDPFADIMKQAHETLAGFSNFSNNWNQSNQANNPLGAWNQQNPSNSSSFNPFNTPPSTQGGMWDDFGSNDFMGPMQPPQSTGGGGGFAEWQGPQNYQYESRAGSIANQGKQFPQMGQYGGKQVEDFYAPVFNWMQPSTTWTQEPSRMSMFPQGADWNAPQSQSQSSGYNSPSFGNEETSRYSDEDWY